MEDYNNKTKAELLEIIQNLEKKVEQLSSESASGRKERFRDRYSKRILDNLPDMLTVLDRNANIVELVSSPSTNHVEGTTADSITQSNIKDILPEDAYNNIRRNMEKVFSTGNSAIARHDLMQDGVSHHYEHWLSLLDKEYLLCMCRDVSQLWETEQTNAEQQNEIMRLNSLMQAIVNNVPVYLFVKDSGNDFRYLYWNKTFADYSGIPIEKAIGRNDFEIFKRTEDMEKFRLFFLEDCLSPEQSGWFKQIRQHCTTPLAMGELFNNPNEWLNLITEREIDYIRIHLSQIGGITPARKLIALCDAFGIRTAWHGPIDLTPIGHAVNIHLDMASPNFGILEWAATNTLSEDAGAIALHQIFTGIPEMRDGYLYLNGKPGIGVDIDEKAAAEYPCSEEVVTWDWMLPRLPDGTAVRP